MSPIAAGGDATDLICSGKGCPQAARWALLWNNPKIHSPERRKVWLACDEHRGHLETFLDARSFRLSTIAVEDLTDVDSAGDRP